MFKISYAKEHKSNHSQRAIISNTISLNSKEFWKKIFPLGNITHHSHLLNNKNKMLNRSENKLLHNLQGTILENFPTIIVTKPR